MIARRLLEMHGKKDGLLLDPFVGSGTTLAEAKLYGMNSVGFDLNPLAILISEVKSHHFTHSELDEYYSKIKQLSSIGKLKSFKKSAEYLNLSQEVAITWYTKRTVRELAMLLYQVRSLGSGMLEKLGLIVIGELLRKMSFQRLGEAKKYRKEGWRNFAGEDVYIPVIPKFIDRLDYVVRSMKEFSDRLPVYRCDSDCFLYDSSVETGYPNSIGEIDLVITSPPYGDSTTTVAYEQQSWFANNGLGLDTRPDSALAKEMLGGGRENEGSQLFGYPTIDSILNAMPEDTKIKNSRFLNEYYNSIRNVSKRVVKGGVVCYVVGNRSWKGAKGRRLRLDLFTKWAFERNGFKLIDKIIERNVINKSQPVRSSNDGISSGSGEVVESMNKEYIVRLRKL